jgi:sigma-B regulation protein RsbU (phosphoserine phosphatase)
MVIDLDAYIKNLTSITAEKERISAELSIATQIQANMLPNIFPDREEFDHYAVMVPAKEVGGDFYDFFFIDSKHLGIVIADVSGKSIPAALFMVVAKTLINNHAREKETPQEVFMNVNNLLRDGNETAMFVTSWFGVLELDTYNLTYVNAGHNPPLLKKGNGSFEYLKTPRGFVLAGIDNFKYKQLELQLSQGDTLFLYTDGVTEANNQADELYGGKRLQNILNLNSGLPPTGLLPIVKEDIDKFAQGAPQFDDITMLALKIKKAGINNGIPN